MKQLKKDGNGGFTLIELVVVMALIAILALMVIGAVVVARNMITETRHRNNGKALQVAMEKYYAANGSQYPTFTGNFNGAAAAAVLNITLDVPASEDANCRTGATAAGGGTVTSTSTGFTITPYNKTCTNPAGGTFTQPN